MSNSMWDFNPGVIDEFRANGGKVGGPFAGRDLLLLTTTGAKSGQQRTSPLLYFTDDDRLYVIASQAGAPNHPGWYHNLLANPEATVEIGDERHPVRAKTAEGADRDRLFAAAVTEDERIGESQRKTARTIPVVFLDRTD
jgi:deazaflavin-dependent oxidoreductase (nitroreductase family)